jgi:dolichol kinase
MSGNLVLSAGAILGSVALLAGVLAGVSAVTRRFGLQPELGRKLVHISLGLYCLTFPLIFHAVWEVVATCALASGVLLLARYRPRLGAALHGVARVSLGELMFAASVALLFYLKDGCYVLARHGAPQGSQPVLYVLPLLILTLSDAASALVGVNYGRLRFRVEDGYKSVEGVVAFVLTAWLLALISLLVLTDLPRGQVIVLALITALFGALFEAASWRGLDNLFIPIGLYFVLANLMPHGIGVWVGAAIAFAAAAALLMALGAREGLRRTTVAAGASLLFCVVIFAGPLAVLTPGVAFAAYLAVWRSAERRSDAVDMIAAALTLALGIFLLSNLLARDTIFAFNLAFASLAAAILARFGRLKPGVLALLISAICAAALVRVVIADGFAAATLMLAAPAAGVILLVVAVAAGLKRLSPERPWLKLSALSFVAGQAALLLPPGLWPAPEWAR